MASVNKVLLIGNLGRDPEVRYLQDGAAVANISLATSFRWKDKSSGEDKEETEWHRVSFRGRLAEVVGEYLKKGSTVYVEGRLRTRKWKDKEGVERYTTEIIANSMQMLGPKPATGGGESNNGAHAEQEKRAAARQQEAGGAKKPAGKFDDMEDDIPF